MKKMASSLFGCTCLAVAVFCSIPRGALASSITLDDADQTVAAPTSGFTTLDFSGTVMIDQFRDARGALVDSPTDVTHTNSLLATLDSAFAAFSAGGTGSYTGLLFTVQVPAGTPPDYYAYSFTGLAQVTVFTATAGGPGPEATAVFSVTVTDGGGPGPGPNPVPESGSTLAFLGVSLAALAFFRRGPVLRGNVGKSNQIAAR